MLGIWLLKAGVLNEHVLSQLNSAFYRQHVVISMVLKAKVLELALCPPMFGVFGIGEGVVVGCHGAFSERWRQYM